ncbi:Androgen-induced gene 1 protein [Liparis tanakae]|uniref:Androgen-induced gene 1 protein n=1 Tax=Liparis tanakae TaxID=230148 RepID=A0A4Z2ERE4_9TELE|nr:Androgen-induced gene 1 protein [Liparis tanakae]
MRTTNHRYPSRSWGLAAVCCFGVGYILWTCWVHQVTGVWVYPVLEHLSPVARVVFFSAMTALICVFYTLGEILNSYIWDNTHTALVAMETSRHGGQEVSEDKGTEEEVKEERLKGRGALDSSPGTAHTGGATRWPRLLLSDRGGNRRTLPVCVCVCLCVSVSVSVCLCVCVCLLK